MERTTTVIGSTVHKTEAVVEPTRFMPPIKANKAMLHVIIPEAIQATQDTVDI